MYNDAVCVCAIFEKNEILFIFTWQFVEKMFYFFTPTRTNQCLSTIKPPKIENHRVKSHPVQLTLKKRDAFPTLKPRKNVYILHPKKKKDTHRQRPPKNSNSLSHYPQGTTPCASYLYTSKRYRKKQKRDAGEPIYIGPSLRKTTRRQV